MPQAGGNCDIDHLIIVKHFAIKVRLYLKRQRYLNLHGGIDMHAFAQLIQFECISIFMAFLMFGTISSQVKYYIDV